MRPQSSPAIESTLRPINNMFIKNFITAFHRDTDYRCLSQATVFFVAGLFFILFIYVIIHNSKKEVRFCNFYLAIYIRYSLANILYLTLYKFIFSRTPNQNFRCFYPCKKILPVPARGKNKKRIATHRPHADRTSIRVGIVMLK